MMVGSEARARAAKAYDVAASREGLTPFSAPGGSRARLRIAGSSIDETLAGLTLMITKILKLLKFFILSFLKINWVYNLNILTYKYTHE